MASLMSPPALYYSVSSSTDKGSDASSDMEKEVVALLTVVDSLHSDIALKAYRNKKQQHLISHVC
jgi:hypothetical protein